MEIVHKNIDELIAAEYNPRRLTTKQRADLKSSLKRFGIVDPIVINTHKDRRNIIIGGHQRASVWEELGNDIIPCVEVSLTKSKERELNVRLNKNTGEFDFELLEEHFEVDELIEWGFEDCELDFGEDLDESKEVEVIPFVQAHVLISYPLDMHDVVIDAISNIVDVPGVDIEKSAN